MDQASVCPSYKQPYASRADAQKAATAIKRRDNSTRVPLGKINVYRCGHCGCWHFGRDTRKPRRPLADADRGRWET